MQKRAVQVRISTYGKAPPAYGHGALKVGLGTRGLLVRAGWTHAGSGREYEYVIPPSGVSGRHPVVELQVPTDEEILSIALRMHARRKSCVEVIEGFIIQYRPSGETKYQITETVTYAPGRWGEREGPQPPVLRKAAELTFGVDAPWRVELVWDHGEENPPTWTRH